MKPSSGCDQVENSFVNQSACQFRAFKPTDMIPSGEETLLHFSPLEYGFVMKEVGKQLGLEILGYANEAEIEAALKTDFVMYKKTVAAIIFSPLQLNQQSYSIRQKSWMGVWNTDRLYSLIPSPAPRTRDPFTGPPFYFQTRFLALQSAIDSHVTGVNLSSSVLLQKFPHPPYTKDLYLAMIPIVYPLLMLIAYGLLSADLVRDITEQRVAGLKEFMEMKGLKKASYWTSWYLIAFATFFPGTIINLLILFTGDALKFSNAAVILVFLVIFALSSTALSMFISCFVKSVMSSMMWSVVVWLILYSPFFFLESDFQSVSSFWKNLFCLLPPLALAIGCRVIGDYEASGDGLLWSNLTDEEFGISFLAVLTFLVIDIAVFTALAIYVDAIFPYKFGYQKNWRICCCRSDSSVDPESITEATPLLTMNHSGTESYEAFPTGTRIIIDMNSVAKSYRDGTQTVIGLNNMCMRIAEGDITVVLGPNGSGKSTLLALMAGYISPSHGTITVSGVPLAQQLRAVQQNINYLPQNEPLFDEMTVREHLVYYATLRGLSKREVGYSTDEALHLLGITPLSDHKAGTLSGGQKRKLSLAMSLTLNPSILILDEPLAGLDIESRKLVCSILEDLKSVTTVIICSHSVDETFQIADRIAILSNKSLYCYGSPDFMKRGLGIGYTVRLVKDTEGCQDSKIRGAFVDSVPKSTLKLNNANEMHFALPKESGKEMAAIITQFEENSRTLGIQSIAITENSLVEAYNRLITGNLIWNAGTKAEVRTKRCPSYKSSLKISAGRSISTLGSTRRHDRTDFSKSRSSFYISNSYEKDSFSEENWPQLKQQRKIVKVPNIISPRLWASFIKNYYAFKYHWFLTLSMIFLPAIFCVLMFLVLKIGRQSDLTMPILLWATAYPRTTLPYTMSYHEGQDIEKGLESTLISTDTILQNITQTDPAAMDLFLLDEANRLGFKEFRNSYVVAEELGSVNNLTARFADASLHSAPISLSIAHNAILSAIGANKSTRTVNKPLPPLNGEGRPGSSIALMTLYLLGVSFLVSLSVVIPAAEISSGARHIQLFSGLQGHFFWLGTYCVVILIGMLASLFCTLTVLITKEPAFTDDTRWLYVYFITCLYFLAGIPQSLLISNFLNSPTASYATSELIHKGLGFVTIVIFGVFQLPQVGMQNVADSLSYVFMTLPSFAAAHAMSSIYRNFYLLQSCRIAECTDTTVENYLSFSQPGIGGNITALMLSSAIYLTLLLSSHTFKKRRLSSRHRIVKVPLISALRQNEGVEAERNRILSIENYEHYPIVLRDISKYYSGSSTGILGLNDLTLGVSPGETVGLIGGNGAGKTTAFKVLTGQILDYNGKVLYNGKDLRVNPSQSCVGYCPQFPVLINSLSVWEHMVLFARIKGQFEEFMVEDIVKILKLMGLLQLSNTIALDLSSGHKKKLGVSLALIGVPSILLLDEPTTGMDEEGKKILIQILNKLRDKGSSIIITSHHMSECEAICNRIGILSHGSLCCLGDLEELKEKHANYTIVTITLPPASQDELDAKMAQVGAFFSSNFSRAEIKEIKECSVTYSIPATKDFKWSDFFTKMELNSMQLGIVDYSISQASLAHVYFSLTEQ